jgi:hypothetical protein
MADHLRSIAATVERITWGFLLCLLAGCSSTDTRPPRQFGPCQTDPGSFACQVDRHSRAGM